MNIHVRGSEPIIFRLGADDRIDIGGAVYRHQSTDEDFQILSPLGQLGNLREICHAEFESGMHTGEISVDPGYYSLTARNSRRLGAQSLFDLEPDERRLVMHRRRWVEAFLALVEADRASRSDAGFERAIATIVEERSALAEDELAAGPRLPNPSIHQLRNWVSRYLVDGDVMALRDGYCRSGWHGRRLNDVVEQAIAKVVPTYASSNRPTCKRLHLNVCTEINRLVAERGIEHAPEMPSLRTIQRRVNALPVFNVLYGRHGKSMAMRKMRPVLQGVHTAAPFERIEMDECVVNLSTLMISAGEWAALDDAARKKVDRLRLWATVAIDCHTRCVAGVHVHAEAPSHLSSLTCLHHIVVDKTGAAKAAGSASPWAVYGKPDSVFTDNGSAFVADEFKDACTDMHVTHLRPPAGTPHLRPRIERFFGTTASSLLTYFSGQTFANVVAKGDYEPAKFASLTAAHFEQALVRWICDVYHNEAHSGLCGRTPMSVWRTQTRHHRIAVPPNRVRQRMIFGIPLQRSLQKTGIRYLNGYYHCRHLAKMLMDGTRKSGGTEQMVDIRVDPHALSAIAVRTPEGWVTAARTGYGPSSARRSQPYDPATAGDTYVDILDDLSTYEGPDEMEMEALVRDRKARLAAHADFEEMTEQLRLRAGVGDPCPSAKELERARRRSIEHLDQYERRIAASGRDIMPEGARPVYGASGPATDEEGRRRRDAYRNRSRSAATATDEASESAPPDPAPKAAAPKTAAPKAPEPSAAPRPTESRTTTPPVARRSAADLDD